MEYLALFDNDGVKVSGKVYGIHYKTEDERNHWLSNGYVVTSQEDFNLYCNRTGGDNGTGYIRDPETGKPISAPPYVPTKVELADRLFNECQADLKEIDAQIINAIVIKDNELIEELREERDERIAEYQADIEDLEEGEE